MISPSFRIFLNIAATYGRSIYAVFCGVFISRWVLISLGKSDFGLYGVVGGITVFITFLNTLLSIATARFYAYAEGEKRRVSVTESTNGLEVCRQWFSTAVALHTVIPTLLMIAGYPLGLYAVENWLTIPTDRLIACRWVFRYACVSCFIGMVNVPFNAMYTAKQYIAELTIYSVVSTTANLLFVCYMVTHPGDWLTRYALWMCIVAVVPQLIICIRALKVFPECRFKMRYALDYDRIRKLSAFAFWQAFGGMGAICRGQGLQILINKYFDTAHNASMSIANQVATHSQTLSGAMQGAFAPAITTACGAGKNEEMRSLAYRACKFGLLFGLIFVVPLSLELRFILDLWLVDPPPGVVKLCWCMLIMLVIDKSASGHMLAVAAVGKVAAYQTFLGGSLILTLPLAWFLVERGCGFVAVGYSMISTMILCAWGRVWFARKLAGMSARYWFFKILLPSFLVCMTAFISGYVVRFAMQTSIYRLCITTLVCEITLFPLAWMFVLDVSERQFTREKICLFLQRVRL